MEFVEPIRSLHKIEEMKKALNYYGSNRDVFLFTLGINCGLRVSDLLQLKKKDIMHHQLRIRETKTNKLNSLPLRHINKEIDEYIRYLNNDDYLFKSSRSNKPIGRVQAYRILNKAADSIGLENIGTHTLRKTFAYWWLKRTNDVAFLTMLLNHSNTQVTLRYAGIQQDIVNETFSRDFGGL